MYISIYTLRPSVSTNRNRASIWYLLARITMLEQVRVVISLCTTQRDGGEPSALTVNQKQRVNTCHIFLMESGTNTVKQTRRDAPDTRLSRLLSIFSYHINSSTHFFVGADLEPTKL